MHHPAYRRVGAGMAVTAALMLGGCVAAPKPLYYWGDYQPQVYQYLTVRGDSPQAQLARLDETRQKALSENAALPPGFNAHLGLLYLKAGQGEKARSAFLTEEAQFPESKPFMDFLMKDKGAASAPPKAGTMPSQAPPVSGKAQPAAIPRPAAPHTPAAIR